MANTEAIDLIFWANALGGLAMMCYAYFLWMQARGMISPSARMLKLVQNICFCLLLIPVAAHLQFTKETILALSVILLVVAFLIKLRRKIGM